MENEIVISEDEMEDITTTLANSSVDVSNTGEQIHPNFSGAVQSGLLGDTINVVSRQVGSISKSIGNMNNAIKQFSYEMINYDEIMADKINDIEIPQNYLINDSSQVNSYTQYLVAKQDGQSVNNGQTTQEVSEISDSVINEKALEDIHGDVTNEQSFDDTSSLENQENIATMDKQVDETTKEYDESSEILSSSNLGNINNEDVTDNVQYDENSSIQNQSVSDITNNQNQELFDASVSVDEKINKENYEKELLDSKINNLDNIDNIDNINNNNPYQE